MISWLWLIPAVQVGVMIGILLVSLLQMSRLHGEDEEGAPIEQTPSTERL
jgi:hypothetical protein